MDVLVTGGTGFVGSHCVAELAARGHRVRCLVRSPERLRRALFPLGAPEASPVKGDVTDALAVARAVEGCDAVLHAANVFSFDPRRGDEMLRVNVEGTRTVLDAARRAGCDPVVHVSSIAAVLPSDRAPVPADAPLSRTRAPYSRSKALAEGVAREAQAAGAPVVVTRPGAVLGPHDPGPGEMVHTLRGFLGNRFPFHMPTGAFNYADVHWLARVHAALFAARGGGPRTVNAGGTFVTWTAYVHLLRSLTGRRLPTPLWSPAPAARAMGWCADLVQHLVPVRLPFSSENTWLTLNTRPFDDTEAVRLAGPPPALAATVAEAIRWCVRAGHLPAAWAGQLAHTALLPAGAA